MHSLYHNCLLWALGLVGLTTSKAEAQAQSQIIAARQPVLINVTSPNNRFADLFVYHDLIRPEIFTLDQLALGFINAAKLQALEDCDQRLTRYIYTDEEYANDPIRIRMSSATGAPYEKLVRCNVLYAIKTLAIDLMNYGRRYEVIFTVYYRSQLLYAGTLDDNRNSIASLEQSGNSSANLSDTLAQGKRALSTRALIATNSSSTLLTIPGSDNVEYRVDFAYAGASIQKTRIFSAILEFMLTLAQRNSGHPIEVASQSNPTDPSWIFVRHNHTAEFSLQGFELLSILEGIARWTVSQGRFAEMIFRFYINGENVAEGCVTAPSRTRAWCHGLLVGDSSSF